MLVAPLGDLKVDEWDQMFDVNVKGVLNGIAGGTGPSCSGRRTGISSNLSSVAGHKVAPGFHHLLWNEVCRGALFRKACGRKPVPGIRCTVISPGAVQTELPTHIAPGAAKDAVDAHVCDSGAQPGRHRSRGALCRLLNLLMSMSMKS